MKKLDASGKKLTTADIQRLPRSIGAEQYLTLLPCCLSTATLRKLMSRHLMKRKKSPRRAVEEAMEQKVG